MDPNACMQEIINILLEDAPGYPCRALALLADLEGWLKRGGFTPKKSLVREALGITENNLRMNRGRVPEVAAAAMMRLVGIMLDKPETKD